MEFLSVGTDYLSSDLFQNIENTASSKPYGGIWATPQNPNFPNYNEWADYLCRNPHILYYKSDYPFLLPASLLTLKENANIFNISSLEDLNFLKQEFPFNNWIDFEKLSQYYDGIYINLSKLKELSQKDIEKLLTFSVNTLIIFNPNTIKHYKSANISIEFTSSIPEYKINIDTSTNYIEPPSIDITILIETIRRYISDNNIENTQENYELIRRIFSEKIKETLKYNHAPKKELLLIRKVFNQS